MRYGGGMSPHADPEAQLNYSSNKYSKPQSGGSINFFAQSTPHVAGARAVSQEFDKFAYTLIAIGIFDLVVGCFVLTCMAHSISIILSARITAKK